jgi:hypothetical protein
MKLFLITLCTIIICTCCKDYPNQLKITLLNFDTAKIYIYKPPYKRPIIYEAIDSQYDQTVLIKDLESGNYRLKILAGKNKIDTTISHKSNSNIIIECLD